MIIVNVHINTTTVITRTATNITRKTQPDANFCEYLVDDGRIIYHKYSDGAAVLAAKMLDGVVNLDHTKHPFWARAFAAIICWGQTENPWAWHVLLAATTALAVSAWWLLG